MPAAAKKTRALAIVKPQARGGRRFMPSPGSADLRRWFMFDTLGMTEQAIAEKEKTNPLNVRDSIDYIKEWKFRNSTAMLDTKFVEVVMSQLDDVGKVYQRGMKAEKVVYVNQKTGKVKKMPDIAMQLKTAAEIRNAVDTIHPKGPLVQNNQQNNFGAAGGGGYGPGASFEAILRKKREEKGLLNSQDTEIMDAELTHEESVADEFKDFGGSGDDDEDEDEDDEGDE